MLYPTQRIARASGYQPVFTPPGRATVGATSAPPSRAVSGHTLSVRKNGPKTDTGSVRKTSNFVPANGSARFNGRSSQSYPIFGPTNTGQMPDTQPAYAKGKENSPVTQLLPNYGTAPGAPSTAPASSNPFGLGTTSAGAITTPQLARVTIGQNTGFTPGEAVNIARQGENQMAESQAQRQQQGIDVLNQGQSNVRDLFGQAQSAINGVGTQAKSRIQQNLQGNISSANNDLMSRGLGNSTVVNGVDRGYQRDAEDSTQGVDEQTAKLNMANYLGLAGTEQQNAGDVANLYTQNGQQDAGLSAILGNVAGKQKPGVMSGVLGSLGGSILGGVGSALGSGGGAGAAAGLAALFL